MWELRSGSGQPTFDKANSCKTQFIGTPTLLLEVLEKVLAPNPTDSSVNTGRLLLHKYNVMSIGLLSTSRQHLAAQGLRRSVQIQTYLIPSTPNFCLLLRKGLEQKNFAAEKQEKALVPWHVFTRVFAWPWQLGLTTEFLHALMSWLLTSTMAGMGTASSSPTLEPSPITRLFWSQCKWALTYLHQAKKIFTVVL